VAILQGYRSLNLLPFRRVGEVVCAVMAGNAGQYLNEGYVIIYGSIRSFRVIIKCRLRTFLGFAPNSYARMLATSFAAFEAHTLGARPLHLKPLR